MGVYDPWLICPILLFVLFWGKPTQSWAQNCAVKSMPDMVIDITSALKNGVRGIDPKYTANLDACIAACCHEHEIADGKECNLLIYDTRKTHGHPNCYMFNCPSPDSCTMSPSKGVMSFNLLREISDGKSHPYPTHVKQPLSPPSNEQSHIEILGIESSEQKEPGLPVQSQGSAEKDPDSLVHIQSFPITHPDSAVQSQSSGHKERGSSLHSQGSAEKGSGSVGYPQNNAERKYSSAIEMPSPGHKDSIEHDQNAAGKNPPSAMHESSSKREPQKSSSKDAAEVQRHITSQMLHLTENIEKHLDQLVETPVQNSDNSMQIIILSSHKPDPTPGPIATNKRDGVQTPDKEINPDQAAKTQSTTIRVPFPQHASRAPQPIIPSHKLNASMPSHHPVPVTKINVIDNKPVPSSVSKDIKKVIGHSSSTSRHSVISPTPKYDLRGQPMTKTRVQGLGSGHQALTSLPITPHTQFVMLTDSSPKATQKSIVHAISSSPKQPVTVILKAPVQTLSKSNNLTQRDQLGDQVPIFRKLDTSVPGEGKHSFSDDVSGLVAALVFGVLFLLVVIGLISRKISEARRRHRYTKLDYLINGMYVDT
ncbi:Hypothetical predicted protein [Pelobates cultripes]|uniref:MANSC domain-containing protein n=1 Tax=Pelobates cultripes TaxID=61616 RepID=A0AAD1W161_PELCU|nr:Hypothetical predicted protein [Pelobates cultripes]